MALGLAFQDVLPGHNEEKRGPLSGLKFTPTGILNGHFSSSFQFLILRLEARCPYHGSGAMTRSPSPLAWRPDFPGAPREAH